MDMKYRLSLPQLYLHPRLGIENVNGNILLHVRGIHIHVGFIKLIEHPLRPPGFRSVQPADQLPFLKNA
ncbi:hypothetical protein D3C80_1760440 [compost metagenome]